MSTKNSNLEKVQDSASEVVSTPEGYVQNDNTTVEVEKSFMDRLYPVGYPLLLHPPLSKIVVLILVSNR